MRQSVEPETHRKPFVINRMQKDLPTWTRNYHEALDQLEKDIVQAQRVLRRDLAICQQERMEQEAAAEAVRQDKAQEVAPPPTATASLTEDGIKHEEKGTPAKDMVEFANSTAAVEIKADNLDAQSENVTSSSEDIGQSQPTAKPADTSDTKPANQESTDVTKDTIQSTASADPAPDQAPNSASLKDLDIDSMFNDSIEGGNDMNPESNANHDFDFDMTLPDDNNNNENTLSNDVGQTSMDSLLPGLESYANSLGDTGANCELNISELPTNEGATTQADTTQDTTALTGDSTFDDLFSYADFEMGQNSGQGDGGTDFEDLFVNLD